MRGRYRAWVYTIIIEQAQLMCAHVCVCVCVWLIKRVCGVEKGVVLCLSCYCAA